MNVYEAVSQLPGYAFLLARPQSFISTLRQNKHVVVVEVEVTVGCRVAIPDRLSAFRRPGVLRSER
jgi:hypothetical protein